MSTALDSTKAQYAARRLGKPAITVALRRELLDDLTRQLAAGPLYLIGSDSRFREAVRAVFAPTERLQEDRRQGYRYEGMPPQREAWRAGLAGVHQAARALRGRPFVELAAEDQDAILRCIEGGSPPGDAWEGLDVKRFFASVLCDTAVTTYYAHPLEWNETGYNGPSSPRGHVRKWIGGVDPWEAHQRTTLWDTA